METTRRRPAWKYYWVGEPPARVIPLGVVRDVHGARGALFYQPYLRRFWRGNERVVVALPPPGSGWTIVPF